MYLLRVCSYPESKVIETKNGLTTLSGLVLIMAGFLAVAVFGETPKRGGIVLQFDDGWASWRSVVAPELARVGGVATAFVNNQCVHNGRISFADLRALQDDFGWEIGSHSYNHYNAIRQVQQYGLDNWLTTQLDRSLLEMRSAGLKVNNFVFPFNVFSPELAQAVRARGIDSFRRADTMALATGRRTDGSLPGTSIDLTRYLPLAVLQQWVDLAHARGQVLFLYGHRVIPDDGFVTGRVVQVSDHELRVDTDVILPQDEDLVLVPDMARRSVSGSIGRLELKGRIIRTPAESPSLTRLTAPGATFLIGPAYGTRLSDFCSLIKHASECLVFYTVADFLAGRQAGGVPSAVDPQYLDKQGGIHEPARP